MKVLTLTQPWASLVAIGAKRIETRSWKTAYRGPLAIHAARGYPSDCRALCHQQPFARVLGNAGYHTPASLPLGAIVAIVELTDCFRTELIRNRPEVTEGHERDFGDYVDGRWGWMLASPRALAVALPWKGAQGLRVLPDDVIVALKEATR